MKYITTINGNEYEIDLQESGQILVNGEPYQTDIQTLDTSNVVSMLVNNRSYEAVVDSPERELSVSHD